MRILLAEDDQVLADGLCRSLRSAGYALDHVAHGNDVLALHEFDLLILDLGPPRLPGLEVLRRMRARNSGLPFLILTAADSVEQRVRGLAQRAAAGAVRTRSRPARNSSAARRAAGEQGADRQSPVRVGRRSQSQRD